MLVFFVMLKPKKPHNYGGKYMNSNIYIQFIKSCLSFETTTEKCFVIYKKILEILVSIYNVNDIYFNISY